MKPRYKRWIKRIAKSALGLVVLILVLVLILQTPWGKNTALDFIASRISSETNAIAIGRVTGFFPFHMRINSLRVSDSAGVFLDVNDFAIDIALAPLLRGRLHVETIDAGEVVLHRRPKREQPPPLRIPELPRIPDWFRVEALHVERLQLEEPVVGAEATFTIDGKLASAAGERRWGLDLDVQRVDAEGTHATIAAESTTDALDLAINVRDDVVLPGLVHVDGPFELRLRGDGPRDDWTGALHARMGGREIIAGELRLVAQQETHIALDARAALTDPVFPEDLARQWGSEARVHVRGTLIPEGVLTLEPLALSTPLANIHISGDYHLRNSDVDLVVNVDHEEPSQWLKDDQKNLPPAAVTVSMKGTRNAMEVTWNAALGDSRLTEGSASLQLGDETRATGRAHLWAAAPLVPGDLAARFPDGLEALFDVAQDSSGAIEATELRIAGSGAQLAVQGTADPTTGAINVIVDGNVEQVAPLFRDAAGVSGSLHIKGAIEGDGTQTSVTADVDANDIVAADLSLPRVTLTAKGAWDGGFRDPTRGSAVVTATSSEGSVQEKPLPALQLESKIAIPGSKRVVVESFALRDDRSRVSGAAVYTIETGASNIQLTLDAPLDAYPQWLSVHTRGNAHLEVMVAKEAELPWTIAAAGTVSELEGLPAAIQAIAGANIAVEVDAQYQDVVTLQSATVTGAHGDTSAAGTFDPKSKEMDITATASVTELAVLDEAIDTAISGAFSLNAKATGALDALGIDLAATINQPAVGVFAGRHAEATVHVEPVEDTQQFQARAAWSPVEEGPPLIVEAAGSLGGQSLQISTLAASHLNNRIEGSAHVNLESRRASGSLRIDAPDIATLAAMTDQPIDGEASGRVAITEDGAVQLSLQARDLTWRETSVAAADVSAGVEDVYESPSGTFSAELTTVAMADAILQTLTVNAEGDQEMLAVALDTSGVLSNETAFAVGGAGNIQIRNQRVEVTRLAGNLGEYPIALREAATVAFAEARLQLEPIELTVGEGGVRLAGTADSTAVDLSAEAANLPLSILQLFGAPAVEGTATGAATITGAGKAPTGHVELRLENLRSNAAPPSAPPATVTVTADLSSTSMTTAATVTAQDVLSAEARGILPVTWTAWPWSLDIADEAPLQGELTAEGNLAALPTFLVLPEHQVTGQIDAQLSLHGTRGSPRLTGDATVRGGRYENVETGTILSSVEADLTGENNTLRLARFAAAAGPDGSVTAQGDVVFLRDEPVKVNAQITLENARFIHRDDATARATGELQLRGTLPNLTVEGDVIVGPADIALPEMPGAATAELDVTEVNLPPERARAAADVEAPEEPGIIDLNVHVSAPGRVFVRGRGLDSEWHGDVQAEGTANAPALRGTLGIVQGHMSVLGRRFEFEDSTINFNGQSPPEPYLNLHAVADAGDVTARLAMTGTLDELNVDLSSDPPLPRDEILARVLFGRSLTQITPLQAVQLARAAATLSGKVEGLPFLAGASRFGVFDRVELRQGQTVEDTALGVGRYIGKDVYVEVEKGLSADAGKARVEVQLSPQVSVEGEVGSDNRQGIGLFWKKDY